MKSAMAQARAAGRHGDVPIGAVIVQTLPVAFGDTPPKEGNSRIIARGENRVQVGRDPTLHAEIVAIRRACKKMGQKFLDDCEIYVTLEPCAMCATAISFARIKRIIFAADDPKGGGVLHNARIFDTDKHLWHPAIAQMPEFAAESAELLKDFFKGRREQRKH